MTMPRRPIVLDFRHGQWEDPLVTNTRRAEFALSATDESDDRSLGTQRKERVAGERQLYQELRLALVFNGGVSLAVWMGGAAKEIDRFRCAFSNGSDELVAKLAAYRELLDIFRTVLVTDTIAGASAGGINGALLAYVVANGKSLECAGTNAIRTTWQQLGSMTNLLYTNGKPKSVLKTDDVLFVGCASVFQKLHEAEADLSSDVSQWVRLAITATDSNGYTISTPGTGGEVVTGKDHRLLMRFRRIEYPSGEALRLSKPLRAKVAAVVGEEHGEWPFPQHPTAGDLRGTETVKFLARAARTTASFPIAFAPSELPLNHVTAAVAPETEVSALTATPSMTEIVEAPSGPNLLEPITMDPNASISRWAVDGGVWDNSPFSAVLRGAEKTPSGRDVRRVVVYLVGTLEPGSDRSPVEKPSLVGSVTKAITLPADVSFANDLERIRADLASQASRSISTLKLLGGDTPAPEAGYEAPDLFAVARQLFPIYRDTLAPASEADALLVSAELLEAPALPLETEPLGAWHATPDTWGWGIQPVRRSIQEARRLLRSLLRTIAATPTSLDSDAVVSLIEARELLSQLTWALDDLAAVVTPESDLDACRAVCGQVMADFAAAVSNVETAATTAAAPLVSATAPAPSLDTLRALRAATTLTGGGATMVVKKALALDITRADVGPTMSEAIDYTFTTIRPESVWPGAVPAPVPATRPPLAGASLHHFGGFMRASWRLHDWMWGRLDANRAIVNLLVTREQVELLSQVCVDNFASELASFVIPVTDAPGGYLNSRTLAMHAFNAHELPALMAPGPLSDDAIEATDGDQGTMIAGWRATLADVYRNLLASVAAGDSNALEGIRADLRRRFRFAIVNDELPDLIQACKDDGAAIDDEATLLGEPDVALIRLNSTELCPKPSFAEFVQDGAYAAANTFFAVGSESSRRFAFHSLNAAGRSARRLARTTGFLRTMLHAKRFAR
jgi:predicted acylesterase/phospholipase RssA